MPLRRIWNVKGTALKTVIARFTEVKELFTQGQLTGEDSEGEKININKIDTALKTVGISLKDFLNGQKGLDDILLELASKWDGLDLATQRYIATMAAGSRQQSRFLALMSNYDRTLELVDAANNSAGASQKQFEKTVDSLESKVNKLTNAWNEFLLGLTNNEVIKAVVSALTGILNTINAITDAISGDNSLIKSILNIGIVFGGLKLGGSIFRNLFASLTGVGKQAGAGFGKSFMNNFSQTVSTGVPFATRKIIRSFQTNMEKGLKSGKVIITPEKFSEGLFDDKTAKKFIKTFPNIGQEITDEFNKATSGLPDNLKKMAVDASTSFNENFKTNPRGALSGLDNSYKNIVVEAKQAGITMNESLDISGVIQKNISSINTLQSSINTCYMAVGMLLNLGLSLLSSFGVESNRTTDALRAMAMVLTTMPMILKMIEKSGVIAGTKIQASFGWISIVITAVLSLTALFVSLWRSADDNSLEARIERAAEATKAAQDAAEQAKSAYDELLSSRDEYSELQKTLEGLTKGTNEWKEALVKANQQVLELLTTYPELAKYISRGEDGQLAFQSGAWDKIINAQAKAVEATSAMSLSAQLGEETLAQENAFAIFENAVGSKDNALRILAAYQADEVNTLSNWYAEDGVVAQLGLVGEKAESAYQALVTYNAAMAESEAKVGSLSSAISNLMIDEKIFDSNKFAYGEGINQIYTQSFSSGYEGALARRSRQIYLEDSESEIEKENGRLRQLADERGILSKMTGDDLHDLQVLYADIANIDISEIPEALKEDKQALADAIAGWDFTREIEGKANILYSKLLGLSDEWQRVIIAYVTGNISDLTVAELKLLDGAGDKLLKLYGNNKRALAEGLGYQEAYVSEIENEDDRVAAVDMLIKTGKMDPNQLQYHLTQAVGLNYISQKEDGTIPTWNKLTDEEKKTLLHLMIDEGYAASDFFELYDEWAIAPEFQYEQDQARAEKRADQQQEDVTNKINTQLGEGWVEKNLSGASFAFLEKFSNLISGMSGPAAKAFADEYIKLIDSAELTDAQRSALDDAIANTDWSDMNNALNTLEYMNELGLDKNTVAEFWRTATEAAGAYVSSVAEAIQLSSRFQTNAQEAADIQKRLTSGEATTADMEALANAGVDVTKARMTAKGWEMDEDLAEKAYYKMVEKNAEEATAAKELTKAKKEWVEGAIGNDQAISFVDKNEDNYYIRRTGKLFGQDNNGKYIAGFNVDELSDTGVTNLATKLNITPQAEDEDIDKFRERVKSEYEQLIELANNGEDIFSLLTEQEAFAYAQLYTADQAAARGGDDEVVRYAMQGEAERAGLDSKEVTDYSDYLMETNNNLSENQVLSDRVAIANAKMNSGLKKLTDTYDDWNGVLDENGKVRKNLSKEDATAYQQMKRDTAEMLGVSGELRDEFFENIKVMKLLEAAAQGDTAAIGELQKLAAEDYLLHIEVDGKKLEGEAKAAAEKLADFIMNYDLPELEAGVELNDQEFINECNKFIAAAGLTVDQVNELFGLIGFEPEVVGYKKIPVSGSIDFRGIPEFIEVPIIKSLTSTGAGGGGITRSTPSGSGGGSGGGSNEDKDWENPYDHLYNLTEKINNSLRIREKLERDYDRILANRSKDADDIYNNMMNQLAALEKEKQLQEEMLSKLRKEGTDFMGENADLNKYGKLIQDEVGNAMVQINWDLIDQVTDEDQGQEIEDYISKLEDIRDEINDAQDGLDDIEDRVSEIYELGKDEYFDFEDKVIEAIINERQKQIDELSAIDETLNETNQKIIDAIQSEIDKIRQDRENQRTEEEISDKQRRLAYLQQDTSGANQVEILRLQKEIDEAQEDYTDTLIDQKISELQEQNDKASDERQAQIDLLNQQLEHDKETGELWSQAYQLMEDGLSKDGGLIRGSKLESILKDSANFTGMSELQKMKWLSEIEEQLKAALNYLRVGRSTEALLGRGELKEGQTITFTTADGKTISGKVDSKGNVTDSSGNVYENVYQNESGAFVTDENFKKKEEKQEPAPTQPPAQEQKPTKPEKPITVGGMINAGAAKIYGYAGSTQGFAQYFSDDPIYKVLSEKNGYLEARWHKATSGTSGWFKKSDVKAYKTGGVADFTGPAWLDGTPSKPEIILNQRDSQNFIALKDVLSDLMSKKSNSGSGNSGDNYFDVDINVEKLDETYDVERVANDVKKLILNDAIYRNVNVINNLK